MASRPNLLVIYCDQMRADVPGYAGRDWALTPHVDRLVDEGVNAAQAITNAPVCMPARWSLHSGQYPHRHGCHSNHHPGQPPVAHLPGCLRAAGYRTAVIGKNHSFLGPDDVDIWMDDPPVVDPAARQQREAWAADPAHRRLGRGPAAGGVGGDRDADRTAAALATLAAWQAASVDSADSAGSQADKPWFLWLSYLNPHTPYHAPDPYHRVACARTPPAPALEARGLAEKPFRQQFHQANNDALIPFDRAGITEMRQVYAAQVAMIDAEIGRVLAWLDANGQRDDTLVLFTADHGDYMGDHGLCTKSPSLYDCLVRVPLVCRWPGVLPAGWVDHRPIEQIDLMPTLLAAAGVAAPQGCQGQNLLPFW